MKKKAPILFLIIAIAALPVVNALAFCASMNEMNSASLSIHTSNIVAQNGPAASESIPPGSNNDGQPTGDCHAVNCCVTHGNGNCGLLPSKIALLANSDDTRFLATISSLKSRITVPDTRPPIGGL